MKNKNLYTIIVSTIPAVQALLDTFNVANINDNVRAYIGASLMLVLIILQGIQIYLNPRIKDKALWLSIVALVGYIAGGVLDNLHIIQLSAEAASIVRLVFTILIVITNTIVKQHNSIDNSLNINHEKLK